MRRPLMRFAHHAVHLFELIHELCTCMEPTCGVAEHEVKAIAHAARHGLEQHRARIRLVGAPYQRRVGSLGPDLKLINRSSAKGVARTEEDRVPPLLGAMGELTHARRLTHPVDTHQHDHFGLTRLEVIEERGRWEVDDRCELLAQRRKDSVCVFQATAATPLLEILKQAICRAGANVRGEQDRLEVIHHGVVDRSTAREQAPDLSKESTARLAQADAIRGAPVSLELGALRLELIRAALRRLLCLERPLRFALFTRSTIRLFLGGKSLFTFSLERRLLARNDFGVYDLFDGLGFGFLGDRIDRFIGSRWRLHSLNSCFLSRRLCTRSSPLRGCGRVVGGVFVAGSIVLGTAASEHQDDASSGEHHDDCDSIPHRVRRRGGRRSVYRAHQMGHEIGPFRSLRGTKRRRLLS